MADFLAFLFGTVSQLPGGVRQRNMNMEAEVRGVLASTVQRAEGLKQSLAQLLDAQSAQAAGQEIDAAVRTLKQRLQVRMGSKAVQCIGGSLAY